MVCLLKWLAPAIKKISANKNRPKTITAPCQRLVASAFLEIAIEYAAMNFLLLFNRFPSVFNQCAAEWAFSEAGKFTRAHAESLVGCRSAILFASATWSRESEPKYVCVWK